MAWCCFFRFGDGVLICLVFSCILILAHLVALAVASLRLCSCGMVHTSVETST